MKKVFILAAACILLTSSSSFAGVWDKRDPGVVRAEGILEGTRDFTIPAMNRWLDKFSKYAKKHPQFSADVKEFGARLALVQEQANKLRAMFASNMTAAHPEFKKLFELIYAANEPMFKMMRDLNSAHEARSK